MFKQFDRKKIQPYMDLVTRVDGLDMRSVDNKILQTMIGELFATHRGVCLDDGRKPFVRGRKLTSVADRYNNVKEMIYPPEDKARLYRGNLPNDPVFYGGFSPVGICNELDMSSGEIMQTIVCRKIEESRPKLYLVGELESLSNNGTSSFYIDSRSAYEGFMKSMNDYPEDMYKQIVLDRLLSKRFRERQKNMSDMRLTAYASYQIHPLVSNLGATVILVSAGAKGKQKVSVVFFGSISIGCLVALFLPGIAMAPLF